jgi:hypothetical protein
MTERLNSESETELIRVPFEINFITRLGTLTLSLVS